MASEPITCTGRQGMSPTHKLFKRFNTFCRDAPNIFFTDTDMIKI